MVRKHFELFRKDDHTHGLIIKDNPRLAGRVNKVLKRYEGSFSHHDEPVFYFSTNKDQVAVTLGLKFLPDAKSI